MGWRYVKALSQVVCVWSIHYAVISDKCWPKPAYRQVQEQKYKEGTTILQKGLLQCVDPETDADAVCRSHNGA